MPRGRNAREKINMEQARLLDTPEIMVVTTLGPVETESMADPGLF